MSSQLAGSVGSPAGGGAMIRKVFGALVAAIAWALLTFAFARTAFAADVRHELAVTLDPAARTLSARDRITVRSSTPITLLLDGRFAVDSILVDGRPAEMPSTSAGARRCARRAWWWQMMEPWSGAPWEPRAWQEARIVVEWW